MLSSSFPLSPSMRQEFDFRISLEVLYACVYVRLSVEWLIHISRLHIDKRTRVRVCVLGIRAIRPHVARLGRVIAFWPYWPTRVCLPALAVCLACLLTLFNRMFSRGKEAEMLYTTDKGDFSVWMAWVCYRKADVLVAFNQRLCQMESTSSR